MEERRAISAKMGFDTVGEPSFRERMVEIVVALY
jgi:hypothetical protein